jgi:hypothetical protein
MGTFWLKSYIGIEISLPPKADISIDHSIASWTSVGKRHGGNGCCLMFSVHQ